jgi:GAF domain-containing protein
MAPTNREDEFAEFAWQTTQSTGMVDTITLILSTAQVLLGADGAGLTMIRGGGRLSSTGETSAAITRSDELQHQLREGPCVEAATQTHNVLATDLALDTRWPRWGPQAAELGLHSVLSATLHTAGDRRLGALNLYGHATKQFTTRDLETARLFAAHALAALWSAIQTTNLTTALETRTEIGQATGILMNRYNLTADQATNVLKRYSQDTNTKLRDLAEKIVFHRGLPGTESGESPTSTT